jgi:hypothetical protein
MKGNPTKHGAAIIPGDVEAILPRDSYEYSIFPSNGDANLPRYREGSSLGLYSLHRGSSPKVRIEIIPWDEEESS